MFSAEGFPRPVAVSDLEPGDIFIAYFESRSPLLCLRLSGNHADDTVELVVLDGGPDSDRCPHPLQLAALDGFVARFPGKAAFVAGEYPMPARMSRGCIAFDQTGDTFLVVDGRGRDGAALNLISAAYATLQPGRVFYPNWTLVAREGDLEADIFIHPRLILRSEAG